MKMPATSKTTPVKSAAGRPRESARRGPGYELSEWLDKNWDRKVGMTNEEVANKLGYRAANIVSMWRTGKTKVALDRLPEIANLMKVDLGLLMPMWFEQQLGEAGADRIEQETKLKAIDKIFGRLVTLHEIALVKAVRKVTGKTDPAFTGEQAEAVALVASNEAFALKVIELAAAEGVTLPSA